MGDSERTGGKRAWGPWGQWREERKEEGTELVKRSVQTDGEGAMSVVSLVAGARAEC